MREFIVVNQSKRISSLEARAMSVAVNIQVKRDFAPAWGIYPVPVRVGAQVSAKKDGSSYVVYLLDKPDEPGALGYHTEEGDQTFAKIFVNPVLDNGGVVLADANHPQTPSVASVLSHEVLELLVDPYCNLWAEGPTTPQGSLYAAEVCDPCEMDLYLVNNVALSNFILPEWLNPDVTRKDKYDFLGKLSAPFTMSEGGYMVVRKAGQGDGTEVFAAKRAAWRNVAKHPASRRARRLSQKR